MKITFKLSDGRKIEGSFSKSIVTVGRSTNADFVIRDEAFSRVHCQFEIINGEFFVTDLNSTNGVYLDNIRIIPNEITPLNTFMQIAIGPYECNLEDSTDESTTPHIIDSRPRALRNDNETKITVRVPPNFNKKKNKNTNFFLGVLLLGTIPFFYQIGFDNETRNNLEDDINQDSDYIQTMPMVRRKISVVDDFYSNAIYESLENKKTCLGFETICNDLLMSPDNGGGIVLEEREAYVYLRPAAFFILPHLSYLKDHPMGEKIISHFVILQSELMKKMEKNEIEQIHLVLSNDQNLRMKVLRYHTNQFPPEVRYQLIDLLSRSILGRNLEDAAQKLDLIVPVKEFQKD